jgi:hypothetical protein
LIGLLRRLRAGKLQGNRGRHVAACAHGAMRAAGGSRKVSGCRPATGVSEPLRSHPPRRDGAFETLHRTGTFSVLTTRKLLPLPK